MCVCAIQLGYTLLDIPEDMEGEKPRGYKLGLGRYSQISEMSADVDIHVT